MVILNFLKTVSRFFALKKALLLAFVLIIFGVIYNICTTDKPTIVFFLCMVFSIIVLLNGALRELISQRQGSHDKKNNN
jgi:hypothetical protein